MKLADIIEVFIAGDWGCPAYGYTCFSNGDFLFRHIPINIEQCFRTVLP
ncbi:hypothetical protein HMPREF1057_00844 [Bacteroides finegoldii CL09T03C10]|uniref:Uncharacterized protein n=1 Tax=Bacteroides finegoldii CL09T03C10 TaxID=997888 RepID=K5CEX0_9BACE|nr:hypothetical protein HMPREF1057_00844 [Bacteroides finegoldii CL09T03C10]